jgi:tricarballylate dehydrogenase
MERQLFDVIVIGGGNAALCAALSAAEQGAKVALLERAPEAKRGGNSNFTGGGFRMVHHGAQDIKRVVPDLSDEEIARTDFGEYSTEDYLDDLGRITQYYIDPDLAETLVRNSTDTVHWLMGRGVRFLPNYGRQAYNHEGRFKFFGGVAIYANGGGAGLVESEYKAAAKHGVTLRYGARATALVRGKQGVEGVRVLVDGAEEEFRAHAVVLACGGFEANREWRARYLGPGSRSPAAMRGRFSTPRPSICCATNTRCAERPRCGPTQSRSWSPACRTSTLKVS